MTERPRYSVYVVELVGVPDHPASQRVVYIGHTALTPAERLRHHMTGDGIVSSRHVRHYGRRLLPKLYARLNPLPSRSAARSAEVRLRRELEARGYVVYGACAVGRDRGCRI